MALERFDCHPVYLNHPKTRYILLYSSKRMNPNKIMLIPRLLNVHSPRLVAAERYSCRGHELHRNDGAPNAVVLKSVSALLLLYAREKDFGFVDANWQCTCVEQYCCLRQLFHQVILLRKFHWIANRSTFFQFAHLIAYLG